MKVKVEIEIKAYQEVTVECSKEIYKNKKILLGLANALSKLDCWQMFGPSKITNSRIVEEG